jgi:hypothetical protein
MCSREVSRTSRSSCGSDWTLGWTARRSGLTGLDAHVTGRWRFWGGGRRTVKVRQADRVPRVLLPAASSRAGIGKATRTRVVCGGSALLVALPFLRHLENSSPSAGVGSSCPVFASIAPFCPFALFRIAEPCLSNFSPFHQPVVFTYAAHL